MLALEIEFLTGIYRAALPDGSGAEWPPHPERTFSALTQAWSDGGCDSEERVALEWLESQEPPSIDADRREDCFERDSPSVFVPPNDPRGSEVAVLPDRRRRQSRVFRAMIPAIPIVRIEWPVAAPSIDLRTKLDALARRVASLGHSSSLVRFTFVNELSQERTRLWRPAQDAGASLRVPHEGRLSRLEEWYRQQERPQLGATAHYMEPGDAPAAEPAKSVFGGEDQWFVFEESGGFRPDILAFAQVAKRVRDSLMSLSRQPVPEILSGHDQEGAATANPHIAIVPLANLGWERATGDLLGFAVVLPRQIDPNQRGAALEALAAFAHVERGEEAFAELHFGSAGAWRLEHVPLPARQSLKPARWCKSATTWATVTPILLDRFPERGMAAEEAHLIASACRNIGLPDPVAIEIHKYSAVVAAPAAYPARRERARPDWSFPRGARFASRPRRHVVLHFADCVEGPIILGAGRFYGMGLCLPVGRDGSP